MSRPLPPFGADAAALSLQIKRGAPLVAQLARQLRALVLAGRLAEGARLPSSRSLAVDLGVSRATVVEALEQLASEGFVEGRRGSGVFVSARAVAAPSSEPGRAPAPLPRRAEPPRPFEPGAIDATLAPLREFSRALRDAWRRPDPALLTRLDPFGWPPLREAIARHLEAWRGFVCDPERVLITAGSADAIDIVARLALPSGATAAVEEPGYSVLRDALLDRGARLAPVAVDDDGLDPARLPDTPDLRLILVTPSRQFPLGGAMPAPRRLALIAQAERRDALVVEDDFDSEYRYRGAPLPALASLDRRQRVVYLGSFSKALFSTVRVGFVVLPARLVAPARALLRRRAAFASPIPQPALAELLASGRYAQHIRRSRRVYARRLAAMMAAGAELTESLIFKPTDAGLHVVADLAPRLAARRSDREVRDALARAGVASGALSDYYFGAPTRAALLFNFAAFDEVEIARAARRMGEALRGL